MDIDDIRRTNIRSLEKEAGSPAAIAEKVGMSYAQYLNARDGAKEAKTGKRRGIRKDTAWRFEDAFGKPRGWLDQNHEKSLASPQDQLFLEEIQSGISTHEIPEHIKQTILTLISSSPEKK